MHRTLLAAPLASGALLLATPAFSQTQTVTGSDGTTIQLETLERFSTPWAMAFLPDGRSIVTEKEGPVWLVGMDGRKVAEISNTPDVTPRGQGGMGDFILGPDFESDGTVFLSYVERDAEDDALSGAAVERATLNLSGSGATLSNREVIWRQSPKVTGNGHYGHRLAVAPDGQHLFITSGERQKFTPAQNMEGNLGKVVRLRLDGSVPDDNPFAKQGGVTAEIWTLGHRNPLGIDFDADGQLWVHEMGPRDGDELNRIVRSENYGYPEVSDGKHYSGKDIPDHSSNPIYENPAKSWVPAISPAGFVIYKSDSMPLFTGDGFIGAMNDRGLVRVGFERDPVDNVGGSQSKDGSETVADEVERFEWGERVREVEQGPDGALYILEDPDRNDESFVPRLLRLTLAN